MPIGSPGAASTSTAAGVTREGSSESLRSLEETLARGASSRADKREIQKVLKAALAKFTKDMRKGKLLMKLGKNGRLFYRLCTIDHSEDVFSIHIRGAIVEFPFESMHRIDYGYNFAEGGQIPISLPSESLAASIVMKLGPPPVPRGAPPLSPRHEVVNLVFGSVSERDEYVVCMLLMRNKSQHKAKARMWRLW